MKAEIPETIPASIVSAKTGLALISARIVPPAGIDLYSESVNDEPMTNSIGIATMSPTDHLPRVVFGVILQVCFLILSTFRAESQTFSRIPKLTDHSVCRFCCLRMFLPPPFHDSQ